MLKNHLRVTKSPREIKDFTKIRFVLEDEDHGILLEMVCDGFLFWIPCFEHRGFEYTRVNVFCCQNFCDDGVFLNVFFIFFLGFLGTFELLSLMDMVINE